MVGRRERLVLVKRSYSYPEWRYKISCCSIFPCSRSRDSRILSTLAASTSVKTLSAVAYKWVNIISGIETGLVNAITYLSVYPFLYLPIFSSTSHNCCVFIATNKRPTYFTFIQIVNVETREFTSEEVYRPRWKRSLKQLVLLCAYTHTHMQIVSIDKKLMRRNESPTSNSLLYRAIALFVFICLCDRTLLFTWVFLNRYYKYYHRYYLDRKSPLLLLLYLCSWEYGFLCDTMECIIALNQLVQPLKLLFLVILILIMTSETKKRTPKILVKYVEIKEHMRIKWHLCDWAYL